jgi:hypothetical protein
MQISSLKPTKYAVKTKARLNIIQTTLSLFKGFYQLGYKTKNDVFIQLIINYPEYNTLKGRYIFTSLWHFKTFNNDLLNDLQNTINNINNKRV